MASVPHALTTTAKVKTYLGISSSDFDAVIDAAVSYATDVVEGYCGNRRFKRTTYANEVYDADGQRDLLLKQWPASAVTAVEYRAGSPATPSWTAFTTDDYLSYLESGILGFLAPLPRVRQGVRVSYSAGYLIDFTQENTPAAHNLPFDLCLVATELAAKLYEGRKALGVTTMATEGQSVTFADAQSAFTPAHKTILKRYQRRVA